MENINLFTAWISILLGLLSGATIGLFFHQDNWLGGYNSWQRRMLRLAHISFFGTAFLNLGFVISTHCLGIDSYLPITSIALILGAITMPLVCALSSWRKPCRHLFFIPVLCLVIGAGNFILERLLK